ncbi:MAG: hypothetical protein FJ290_08885 [Planctomycetes bacterium]|nr:hypothetical protein [Planctomycetota bacterium]
MRPSWLPSIAFALLLARAAAGPSEDYVDAQLRVVKGLEEQVPSLARIADEAARKLIAGGKPYLAGEYGMVMELHVRAGGLCATRLYHWPKTQLSANDIVLVSDYGARTHPGLVRAAELGLWNELDKSGALFLVFTSEETPSLEQLPATGRAILLKLPADSRVIRAPSGELLLKAASPAIAIAQWAFVAELIGACRRQGKQLAVYLSIHLDEGRKRFERTKGLVFEPDLKPEPARAGQFAKEFLGHVRTALEAVRKDEAANKLGARTIFLTSLGPGAEQARDPLHLYVNPHWPLSDGCLDLPGYEVKACPLSGIMGITVYHAICAEAVAGK